MIFIDDLADAQGDVTGDALGATLRHNGILGAPGDVP